MYYIIEKIMSPALFAALLSFGLSALVGPFWIKGLRTFKLKQYVREDGPQHHLAKSGVPTMGGVIFLFPFIVISLFSKMSLDVIFVLVSTFSFATVGFVDDFGKVTKKQNEGLTIKGKSIFILTMTIIVWFLFLRDFSVSIPFTDIRINNVVLTVAFVAFLYSAVTNATNFTDGLDGLLASVTFVISIFYIYAAIIRGNEDLFVLNIGFAAAMLGYLIYNWHPAKVMMGDFGSLGIGGYVVANAIILDVYWLIPIFGIWYVIEVASVVIQIVYFKTSGKRFFKMAPYHHHLEALNFSEVKVVLIALGITVLSSMLASFFL